MRFVMLGFTSDGAIRKFRFQAVAAEQARIEVAVQADLALLLRFQIRVQELPLLCWHVIQTSGAAEGVRSLTITESDPARSCVRARLRAAETARQQLFRTGKTGGILGSPAPAE